eukprot:c6539_g1_i1.p2 GENE.c6539_g1_i1~~c6539_g1_i1.p2  ORF type:complete len:387 (+),score=68.12 c6539_g1_i1:111-1271(+)
MSSSANSSSGSNDSAGSMSLSSCSDVAGFKHAMNVLRHGRADLAGAKRKMYKDKEFMKAMRKPVGKKFQIKYIDVNKVDAHEFRKNWEHLDRPVMITGAAKKWPAMKKWEPKTMAKNMGNVLFRVSGERIPFKHYEYYARHTKDDSPYYLFEANLEDDGREEIIADYRVPKVFKYDYFGVLPRDLRPPYRWMVIGPERTGTTMHQDPLGTSAWNTLTHGHKRWVMFPPTTRKSAIHPRHLRTDDNQEYAIYWWKEIYPYCLAHAEELQMQECIQAPGDTIFVPGDWWHAVFNVDMTVAITQNFTSRENFRRVFIRSHQERHRFARRWRKVLEYTAPDLALRAKDWDTPSASRYSTDDSEWDEIDALSTLSTSDIGRVELRRSDSTS